MGQHISTLVAIWLAVTVPDIIDSTRIDDVHHGAVSNLEAALTQRPAADMKGSEEVSARAIDDLNYLQFNY